MEETHAETAPAEQEQALDFALDEDGHKLLAIFTPGQSKTPLDENSIRQAIREHGFGEFALVDAALAQLVKRCTGSESFRLEIGEARDAEIVLEVAPDKMAAYLTVKPPQGGAPVTGERIQAALAEHEVSTNIDKQAIAAILAEGTATHQLIAQGRPAVNGEDGKLKCLVDMVKERHPHLDEHGVADYRDLGGILAVAQGQPLMEKIPPTPGETGVNVLGEEIPPKPGKETLFASNLKGAEIDPDNPAILRAAYAGQPVAVANGMTVEPTITIKQVNLASGNVDFDGSVNITGDVHAGMEIRASGDIHVDGTVEAAVLEAGGDVVVKGGIIGHGEIHAHPDASKKSMIARIHCKGSCSARFVENASIEAEDSIMVEQQVMQSELAAMNHIIVGKPGSGRGGIVGGLTEATLLVQTVQLGSPSGVRTRVVVGTNPYLQEKLHQIGKVLAAKANELDEILKLLVFIKNHPGRVKHEILLKATNTRLALLHDMEEVRKERDELTQQLDLSEEAKVVVEKAVFGSAQVEIGGKIHKVDYEREGGTFALKDGDICFE